MDGGRRLLRSIANLGLALPAPAGQRRAAIAKPRLPVAVRPSERRASRPGVAAYLLAAIARPGASLVFSLLVVSGAGIAGAARGGQYAAFVEANGTFADVVARSLGFGLSAVVMTSDNGMSNDEILRASGVTSRSSLLFLDAADVRNKLKSLALVKEASVRKLYPDRLVIDVEERQPFALWQNDGEIAVISADGTAIDQMRDDRFAGLPFVVGAGANLRIGEFAGLLEASGDLRGKIRAGVLVSGRRWTLKMANGVDVKLPERVPLQAMVALVQLQRESRVLDKDVASLDFRMPGRMIARLTTDAAAARADLQAAKKTHGKAGQT